MSTWPVVVTAKSIKKALRVRRELMDFWFGDVRRFNFSMASMERAQGLWFQRGKNREQKREFDSTLRREHEPTVMKAKRGELRDDIWKDEAEGSLAFCVLCNQVAKCMYRGKAKAFELDPLVIDRAKHAIDVGHQPQLHPIEQNFLMLPLVHSENIDDHRIARDGYERAIDQARNEKCYPFIIDNLVGCIEFLEEHTRLLERFGRYPHRNDVLGRESTIEECDYLDEIREQFFGGNPRV
ncbi:Bacterial protein of unknown function (DUF924) [Plasmodiophora brassicae]|nr:hypothetical protein PBRA_008704 [Plasmodiophora brassicae]